MNWWHTDEGWINLDLVRKIQIEKGSSITFRFDNKEIVTVNKKYGQDKTWASDEEYLEKKLRGGEK